MATKQLPVLYDCGKCPGYCCSYEYIIVSKGDVERLARRFDLSYERAEKRFTKVIKGYGRVLRHRQDTVFQSTCQFLHPTERRCTVYEHRPTVCRQFPELKRCHYFDFIQCERDRQDDPTYIPLTR